VGAYGAGGEPDAGPADGARGAGGGGPAQSGRAEIADKRLPIVEKTLPSADRGEGGAAELGERPPDILDDIEDYFSGGVKLPGRADCGLYLAWARGKARERLSTSRGRTADQIERWFDDTIEATGATGTGRLQTGALNARRNCCVPTLP
jgi:hypothetical protein